MATKFRFRGFAPPYYTQVPDQLFDELLPHLSGAELKVLLYIIRRTFGFKKDSDAISLSQICGGIKKRDGTMLDEGTGLSRQTAIVAVKALELKEIIIAKRQSGDDGVHETTTYGLSLLEGWSKNQTTPRSNNLTTPGQGIGPPVVQNSDSQETVVQETEQEKRTPYGLTGSNNDLAGLWRVTLLDLQEQIVPTNYQRWLSRTSLLSHDAGAAVVGVPDQVSADQLARRFDPLVRRALSDACGETVTVQYQVVEG
jgi:hypothetical protein